MTEHTMPMLTDSEREMLAGLAKIEIRRWDKAAESVPEKKYMAELMQIAWAALTADPAGNFTYHEDEDGDPTDFIVESDGFAKNSFKLYTAPPVPTIKLPEDYPDELYDFFDRIYDDRGRVHSAANAVWEMALVEVKRLNGVKE